MTAITVHERLRGAGDDGPGLLAAIHVTAVLGTADAMIDDVAEAEAATERLAAAPPDDAGLAVRDIWLLRLGAFHTIARRPNATTGSDHQETDCGDDRSDCRATGHQVVGAPCADA
jgi:hypothetical protein